VATEPRNKKFCIAFGLRTKRVSPKLQSSEKSPVKCELAP
jgi:hypothetical protein